MNTDLLVLASAVAFVLGSAVGIAATFYLLQRSTDRLHAIVKGDAFTLCRLHQRPAHGDRVYVAQDRENAAHALDRARLCGAHVCPRCLELARRV